MILAFIKAVIVAIVVMMSILTAMAAPYGYDVTRLPERDWETAAWIARLLILFMILYTTLV